MAEVDAFIQRAHQALEARDGSVTAKAVDGVRFKPRRMEGYDMAQVDDELERLAAALRDIERSVREASPPGTPTPFDQLRLTIVRFRETYDKAEVDAFLQRAHRALEARDGSVTAKEVVGVRFKPRRFGGYDMGQVDDELERLAAALREIERPEGR